MNKPVIPKKHQPLGFEIIHEDPDIIVGHKEPGYLTVAALWDKKNTIHNSLTTYVRKGSIKSNKNVYVVHRLDQATSGVLIFAKSADVQSFLKHNWKSTIKYYYAIVHGKMPKKNDVITSYLSEDEDYVVHSSAHSEEGKLAKTEYTVVKETAFFSVLKIKLLTGKKNQIRVHLADTGHPIVGDTKYGKEMKTKYKNLMLHSFSLEITHPFSQKRMRFQSDVPDYFNKVIDYNY